MKIVDVNTINEGNKKRRFAVDDIKKFINMERVDDTVLVLYGLRRTGKTTMMNQIIEDYRDSVKCAFIEVEKADTMDDIYLKLIDLREEGVKIVCLDEITNAEDFIENSAVLADVFARNANMRIILAGTNSLSFNFAAKSALFGRIEWIQTTHIPYTEHSYILGTTDIDDYIEYGGLMERGKKKQEVLTELEMKRYLDSAVSDNIISSIKKDEEESLVENIPTKELKAIIAKMVEIYSGSFRTEKIQNELKSVNINAALNFLYKTEFKNIIKPVYDDKQNITRDFAEIIEANEEIKTKITEDIIRDLKDYFIKMDLLSLTKKRIFTYIAEKGWLEKEEKFQSYIIQPAIKYYHLEKGLKFIDDKKYFDNLSDDIKDLLKKKLNEKIKGDMIEQIVVFDVNRSLNPRIPGYISKIRYDVFKPEFFINGAPVGEYDLLVRNKENNTYYAFEIKHTINPSKQQYETLQNNDITEFANNHFGKRLGVAVLYRGDNFKTDEGIIYLNISDFLIAVNKYKNMELAMDELTKNLEVKSIDEMQKDKNIDLNQQELEIATQEQNTLFTEYDEGGGFSRSRQR